MNTPSLVRPKCYVNNVHLHLFFLFSHQDPQHPLIGVGNFHRRKDYCCVRLRWMSDIQLEDRRGAEGGVCVCRQNVRVVSMKSCLLPGYPEDGQGMSRNPIGRAEAGDATPNIEYCKRFKTYPIHTIEFTFPRLTLPASAPSPCTILLYHTVLSIPTSTAKLHSTSNSDSKIPHSTPQAA